MPTFRRRRIFPASALVASLSAVALLIVAASPVAAVSAPYFVKNINAGSADSEPFELTELNGVLIFSASGGGAGRELWRSDGTSAGTVRVADVRPGGKSSHLEGITRVGSLIYFAADDGSHGREMWVTDGTALGTHMLKDIVPGRNGSYPIQINDGDGPVAVDVQGIAYFSLGSDSRLWRSDGTEAGTYVIAGSPNYIGHLTAFGNRVYFTGDGHLWRSDGTTAGTKVQKNSNGAQVKAPAEIAATDSLLFFEFNSSKLWRSNGTASGTFKVMDLGPGCTSFDCWPMSLTPHGDLMYLQADGLRRSDGTAAGTFVVGPGSDSLPTTQVGAGSNFYFHASDENLWATDGTPDSGHIVDNGPADYCCYAMTNIDEQLWYTAQRGEGDQTVMKLYVYDANTNTSTEIGPATADWPLFMTKVGNRVFFSARDSRGRELWAVNL
jgi:ELWxxDGT repeat protein